MLLLQIYIDLSTFGDIDRCSATSSLSSSSSKISVKQTLQLFILFVFFLLSPNVLVAFFPLYGIFCRFALSHTVWGVFWSFACIERVLYVRLDVPPIKQQNLNLKKNTIVFSAFADNKTLCNKRFHSTKVWKCSTKTKLIRTFYNSKYWMYFYTSPKQDTKIIFFPFHSTTETNQKKKTQIKKETRCTYTSTPNDYK